MPAFLIDEPKCIFVHNPKTGGMTLRRELMDGREFHGPVTGRFPDSWRGYFAFGFIRNPFDRLVSAWKMFSLGIQDTGWCVPGDLKKKMNLLEFLKIATDETIPFRVGEMSGRVRIRNHTLPQSHEFYGLDQVDFLGRFETYDQDVRTIFRRIGLAERTLAARHVSSREKGYQQYFDQETREIAEAYYADDLSAFGYRFEGSMQKPQWNVGAGRAA
jgi:hypothetical protein